MRDFTDRLIDRGFKKCKIKVGVRVMRDINGLMSYYTILKRKYKQVKLCAESNCEINIIIL